MARKRRPAEEDHTLDGAESMAAAEAAIEAENHDPAAASEGPDSADDAPEPWAIPVFDASDEQPAQSIDEAGAEAFAQPADAERPVEPEPVTDPGMAAELGARAQPAAEAEAVEISRDRAQAVNAAHVHIDQGAAQNVSAQSVEMSQGAAAMVRADRANLDRSSVAILVGRKVEAKQSSVFLLFARNVSGDVRVALDWRGIVAAVTTVVVLRRILRRR